MKNQKGFTFIEFLVVLAIFGIIAAIAVPALMNLSNENFFRVRFRFKRDAVNDVTRPALQPLVTAELERERRWILKRLEDCSIVIKDSGFVPAWCNTGEAIGEITQAKTLAKDLGFEIALPPIK